MSNLRPRESSANPLPHPAGARDKARSINEFFVAADDGDDGKPGLEQTLEESSSQLVTFDIIERAASGDSEAMASLMSVADEIATEQEFADLAKQVEIAKEKADRTKERADIATEQHFIARVVSAIRNGDRKTLAKLQADTIDIEVKALLKAAIIEASATTTSQLVAPATLE